MMPATTKNSSAETMYISPSRLVIDGRHPLVECLGERKLARSEFRGAEAGNRWLP